MHRTCIAHASFRKDLHLKQTTGTPAPCSPCIRCFVSCFYASLMCCIFCLSETTFQVFSIDDSQAQKLCCARTLGRLDQQIHGRLTVTILHSRHLRTNLKSTHKQPERVQHFSRDYAPKAIQKLLQPLLQLELISKRHVIAKQCRACLVARTLAHHAIPDLVWKQQHLLQVKRTKWNVWIRRIIVQATALP